MSNELTVADTKPQYKYSPARKFNIRVIKTKVKNVE